jgi:uncharacterized protein (TIGR02996 family)
MTDDQALLRAVLANPEDDALRLVYADWLDERGDPRGEYLRVDLELATGTRGPRYIRLMSRGRELREKLDKAWVVAVSRGPTGTMKWFDLGWPTPELEADRGRKILAPTWKQVEDGFRMLTGPIECYARLRFGTNMIDCDHLTAFGEGSIIGLNGRLAGKSLRFHNPSGRHGVRYRIGAKTTDEQCVCFDLETVIRAAKWAYYYQDFATDIHWTEWSARDYEDRGWTEGYDARLAELDEAIAEAEARTTRLLSLCLSAGIDPNATGGRS